jgi:hypothetical protein
LNHHLDRDIEKRLLEVRDMAEVQLITMLMWILTKILKLPFLLDALLPPTTLPLVTDIVEGVPQV